MIEVSWDKFNQKFHGREQSVFEEVCYHIFCTITKNIQGIFRYKNHPGIETNDVLYQEKHTGFQAKYFLDDLSGHKDDFLDAISKTRKHNTRVQKIIYFLPIDPGGNNRGIDVTLKPSWMQEVEQEALNNLLEIEWFGLSKFQSFFAKEEHQYLARHYFDTNPDLWDFVELLKSRTQSYLDCIHTTIPFNGQNIHIDHSDIIRELSSSNDKQISIISGVGGIGKTAVIKDWFSSIQQQNNLTLLLQPYEVIEFLSEQNILKSWHSSRKDFLLRTKEYYKCILVIDATEKISEEQQLSELLIIFKALYQDNWQIVFTTRTVYLNQLKYHLKRFFPNITQNDKSITPITNEELIKISTKYHFKLPKNTQVCEAIQIPFNLFAYLSCSTSNSNISLNDFENIVWNHFVLGDTPDDMAGVTFCKLIESKLEKDKKYLEVDTITEDIRKLLNRGIIVQQEGTLKYKISHDIYEEWAIIKIFNGHASTTSQYDFEQYILSTYSLRRGFRIWLDSRINKLDESKDDTITALLSSENELIIAEFLLTLISSCNLEKFLDCFALFLFESNGLFFDKIVSSIYHIGRSDKTNPLLLGRQEPLKDSWEIIIHFAFKHLQQVITNISDSFLSLMYDWSLIYQNTSATTICSVICWTIIDMYNKKYDYFYDDNNLLTKIIAASSLSDKDLFVNRLNEHLNSSEKTTNRKLTELCEEILSTTDPAYIIVIKNFPNLVIQIAWKYWRKKYIKNVYDDHDLDRVEHACGLLTKFNYLPLSYLQSPTYQLLLSNPLDTINFIIEFTNVCIRDYVKEYSRELESVIIMFPNGQSVKQYISTGLWNMYRGNHIGDHWPYLLQAMHMALEHYLLEQMNNTTDEYKEASKTFVNLILLKLLYQSISASLTAIVVSLVNAFPNDFSQIALILLSNRQILSFDFSRSIHEGFSDYSEQLFPLPQTEHDIIRKKYDNHPCRQRNLEQVALQYQLFPPHNNPKVKEQTEHILNNLAKDYDHLTNEEQFSILRMDARRQTFQRYKDTNNNIILIGTPQLSEKQKKAQENIRERDKYKDIALKLNEWAINCFSDKSQNNQSYSNIKDVLCDLNTIKSINSPEEYLNNLFYIPATWNTVSALIMFYPDKLDKLRLKQCYKIYRDALNTILNDNFQHSILNNLSYILFTTPFLLNKLNWWKYYTISTYFNYFLLSEDNTTMFGNKRLCDDGFEGIRNYLFKTNDTILPTKIRNKYITEFRKYNFFLINHHKFSNSTPLNHNTQKCICRILTFFHLPIPQWLSQNKIYNAESVMFQHPISRYIHCFSARHNKSIPYDKEIEARLQCNLIQFICPKQLSVQDENSIIDNIDLSFEYLFPFQDKHNKHIPTYVYYDRNRYLKQLSLCILNMTENGRQRLVLKILNNQRHGFITNFLNHLILAEDIFPHPQEFWQIMKSLLPYAKNEIDSLMFRSNEYYELLNALTLTSQKWKDDAKTWNCFGIDSEEYFQQIVEIFRVHSYLSVCICKFINSIGHDYILNSISWLSNILHTASDKYNDNEITILLVKEFESMIPQIEKNIEEILLNQQMRTDLTSILDYLIIQNSREAFKLREAIL